MNKFYVSWLQLIVSGPIGKTGRNARRHAELGDKLRNEKYLKSRALEDKIVQEMTNDNKNVT